VQEQICIQKDGYWLRTHCPLNFIVLTVTEPIHIHPARKKKSVWEHEISRNSSTSSASQQQPQQQHQRSSGSSSRKSASQHSSSISPAVAAASASAQRERSERAYLFTT